MFFHAVANALTNFVALLCQFTQCTGVFFSCVGRHLASVDGEQVMSKQALLITNQQDLLEYGFDRIGIGTDKVGDAGPVGHAIAGQRLEDNVVFALPLNVAAGLNAFGVCEQDDLKQDGWIIGSATATIVFVFLVKGRKVDAVVDEVVKREGETIEL